MKKNLMLIEIEMDHFKKPKKGDLVLFDKRCRFSVGKYSSEKDKKYIWGVIVNNRIFSRRKQEG